jgi:hypothetical protein
MISPDVMRPRPQQYRGHREIEERRFDRMPLVDRISSPLVRRDMDFLLALLLGLVAGCFIWLAVL